MSIFRPMRDELFKYRKHKKDRSMARCLGYPIQATGDQDVMSRGYHMGQSDHWLKLTPQDFS